MLSTKIRFDLVIYKHNTKWLLNEIIFYLFNSNVHTLNAFMHFIRQTVTIGLVFISFRCNVMPF